MKSLCHRAFVPLPYPLKLHDYLSELAHPLEVELLQFLSQTFEKTAPYSTSTRPKRLIAGLHESSRNLLDRRRTWKWASGFRLVKAWEVP
jgi:hypothetical protein